MVLALSGRNVLRRVTFVSQHRQSKVRSVRFLASEKTHLHSLALPLPKSASTFGNPECQKCVFRRLAQKLRKTFHVFLVLLSADGKRLPKEERHMASQGTAVHIGASFACAVHSSAGCACLQRECKDKLKFVQLILRYYFNSFLKSIMANNSSNILFEYKSKTSGKNFNFPICFAS